MRRLDKQIIIRTDEEGKETLRRYCEDNHTTLVELLQEIIERIRSGKLW